MRVAAVLIHSDDGRRERDEAAATEFLQHFLLNGILPQASALPQCVAHRLEGLEQDTHQQAACLQMHFKLLLAPAGLKVLDQICRGSHLLAEALNRLHRAGIHAGDIGNRAERRVFHRDRFMSFEHLFQSFQSFPASS